MRRVTTPSSPALTACCGLLALAVALGLARPGAAQSVPAPPPVPSRQIPPSILAELRLLENQFELALVQDCAPERCFSKGCVYGEHVVADKPRSTSLPGLGEEAGPGSVPSQEYLTQARCEFAHEKSISTRDVQALIKRLEQKLSKGWLIVTVEHKLLEPVSPSLRESPEPPEKTPPPEPKEPTPEPKAPEPPPEWQLGVAMRELWVSLLPHFSWMIALMLVTFAALVLIWALRRLGRESLEEKAMLAQLANGAIEPRDEPRELPAPADAVEPTTEPAPKEKSLAELGDEKEFVAEQMKVWKERIESAAVAQDEGVVNELLREWLKSGEFALLAKAIFVFENKLPMAFSEDGELAMRKIEFAEYIRTVDEQRLPSDAEFFRKLNQHAISSSLLAQADAQVYRSLREEFGSTGVAGLIELLPSRQGALLYALVPVETQHEVARILSPELRVRVATELLLSNRIAKEEMGHVFEVLRAAFAGQPVAPPTRHATVAQSVADRGREFDAAGALSILLPHIPQEQRSALFAAARERASGTFPQWYEEILFPDMLLRVPGALQTDMLLDVDIRSLAGWFSMQPAAWQETFAAALAPSMKGALRASMAFGSRADQLTLARRGQHELAAALQKLIARGQVSFAEVVI